LGPQHQKDADKLQVQQKATTAAWAEHLPQEERPRELGWEKRWLWGHLTVACPYLWGGYGEDRARLFTVVHGRRMSDSGRKLKQQRFRVVTREIFFTVRDI